MSNYHTSTVQKLCWAIGFILMDVSIQGILSGASYYIMGVVVRERGPVFFSAFSPLATIIVAILGSLIFAEEMYLGRLALITSTNSLQLQNHMPQLFLVCRI